MIVKDELQQLVCAYVRSEKLDRLAMQLNKGLDISYKNQNYKEKKYDYCHFNGQTKENCYKLIGYATDQKYMRKANNNNGGPKRFMQQNHIGRYSGTNHHDFWRFNTHCHHENQFASQVNTQASSNSINSQFPIRDADQFSTTSYGGHKKANSAILSKEKGLTDREYKQIM